VPEEHVPAMRPSVSSGRRPRRDPGVGGEVWQAVGALRCDRSGSGGESQSAMAKCRTTKGEASHPSIRPSQPAKRGAGERPRGHTLRGLVWIRSDYFTKSQAVVRLGCCRLASSLRPLPLSRKKSGIRSRRRSEPSSAA
jgi:hypothetical protein